MEERSWEVGGQEEEEENPAAAQKKGAFEGGHRGRGQEEEVPAAIRGELASASRAAFLQDILFFL